MKSKISIYSFGFVFLVTTLLSLAMHWPHFTKDLISIHVWRQTQTQSNTINFYEEDMNILNPRRNDRGDGDGIFRMEFPLYQWGNAALFQLTGEKVIVTRIYSFLIGLLAVAGMYWFLWSISSSLLLPALGAWFFTFSPSFFYFTINPLPDNLALALSIWGLAFFYFWVRKRRTSCLFWSSILIAFAALCKLPFILYYAIPGFYFLAQAYQKKSKGKPIQKLMAYSSSVFLVASWYLWVIPQWESNPIVKGILENETGQSQLLDYLFGNLVSVLPELLLNYAAVSFFLYGIYFFAKHKKVRNHKTWPLLLLSVLLCAYALFELNAIKDVHDYYLFPFLPLLFLLVAAGGYYLYRAQKWTRYLVYLLLLVAPITCYLRMQVRWDVSKPGFNKDLLDYKDELRAAVPDDALVVAGNDESHYIMFYYLHKKGWGFQNSEISPELLESYIERGATYLYTDDADILSQAGMNELLSEAVEQYGSIGVYKLKGK